MRRSSGRQVTSLLIPITLERRHIVADRPNNILKGYTVTNKADGQRCGLFVTRDKRLLRVNPNGQVVFTGITARGDTHMGDFFDGEYLPTRICSVSSMCIATRVGT